MHNKLIPGTGEIVTTPLPSSLRNALREATDPIHLALHHHGLLKPLAEGPLAFADYIWALQAFYTSYEAQESQVRIAVPQDVPSAPILKWLAADVKRHSIQAVGDVSHNAEPINTLSKLIGYLYVKQGSTLGGRVISKRLEKELKLVPEIDNHFFAGYGEATGEQWKAFLAALDVYAPSINLEEACKQAVATFKLIEKTCDEMLARKQAAHSLR